MTSRLIIRAHSPRRVWLRRALVLGLAVLCAWGVYSYGRVKAGYDVVTLADERDELRDQVREVEKERQRFQERVTVLERSAQIDRQAYDEVTRSLTQLQDEILELKEEVAFYRGIVAPAEAAHGLNVTRLVISPMSEARAYRFKLVLTQVKNNDQVIRGKARISLEGVMAGEQRALTLNDLTGGKTVELDLRFKYFQNIEGDIVLPEGFLPSRIIVDVAPVGKGLTALKKPYYWSDVLG